MLAVILFLCMTQCFAEKRNITADHRWELEIDMCTRKTCGIEHNQTIPQRVELKIYINLQTTGPYELIIDKISGKSMWKQRVINIYDYDEIEKIPTKFYYEKIGDEIIHKQIIIRKQDNKNFHFIFAPERFIMNMTINYRIRELRSGEDNVYVMTQHNHNIIIPAAETRSGSGIVGSFIAGGVSICILVIIFAYLYWRDA